MHGADWAPDSGPVNTYLINTTVAAVVLARSVADLGELDAIFSGRVYTYVCACNRWIVMAEPGVWPEKKVLRCR